MSHFFLKEKKNAEDSLKKQIESLTIFFPNQSSLECILPNEIYQLSLRVGSDQLDIGLKIVLGPKFPLDKPIIEVCRPQNLQHPWISPHNSLISGHEALNNWNFDNYQTIGKILKDIEIEFNLRPPVYIHSLQKYSKYEEINNLEFFALKQLNESQEKFENFFEGLKCVKDAKNVKYDLDLINLKLAKNNLEIEDNISLLKERLSELNTILKIEEGELKTTMDELKPALEKYTRETIIENISKLVNTSESKSSEQIKLFLEKSSFTSSDFVDQYIAARKAYHSNRICLKKCKALLK